MSGYVIFKVTTANGSIPLNDALVSICVDQKNVFKRILKCGFSEKFEVAFDDGVSCITANAKISAPGYEDYFVDDLKIYKTVTLVRVVNLTGI